MVTNVTAAATIRVQVEVIDAQEQADASRELPADRGFRVLAAGVCDPWSGRS